MTKIYKKIILYKYKNKWKIFLFQPYCYTCDSQGVKLTAELYPSGHVEIEKVCSDCNGNGQSFYDWNWKMSK